MSDSPQQLTLMAEEEQVSGTRCSVKGPALQQYFGSKRWSGLLGRSHIPSILHLLSSTVLAVLLFMVLAQVVKIPRTQGQDPKNPGPENLTQPTNLPLKNLGSQIQNESEQKIYEEINQLRSEVLSKMPNFQSQNESQQKIYQELNQLRSEVLSKMPNFQSQNESQQKIYQELNLLSAQVYIVSKSQAREATKQETILQELTRLKSEILSKITSSQGQDASKQDKIYQELNQLKAKINALCRNCPWDWTLFQRNCYFVSMSQLNWHDSLAACRRLGAQLVVVKSDEEQSFLQHTAKTKGLTWMGLSDLTKEGTWIWADNSPLPSSFKKYWNRGEPNNIGEEDCVEFSGDGWNDSKCNLRRFWICKKSATSCTSD